MENLNEICELKLSYIPKCKPSLKCSTSIDSSKYCRSLFDEEQIQLREFFYVVCLNRANMIIGAKEIGRGSVCGTVADPRMIAQTALLSNASSVILTHNHPSGNRMPSEQDLSLTKKVKEGLKLLEISVLDHIIITPDGYYSFADEGNL